MEETDTNHVGIKEETSVNSVKQEPKEDECFSPWQKRWMPTIDALLSNQQGRNWLPKVGEDNVKVIDPKEEIKEEVKVKEEGGGKVKEEINGKEHRVSIATEGWTHHEEADPDDSRNLETVENKTFHDADYDKRELDPSIPSWPPLEISIQESSPNGPFKGIFNPPDQVNAGRRHICTFCQKGFFKSGGLKMHLRTHTGEKPFKCPHCVKAFVQATTLKRHIRVHTGEKPYECSYCGKAISDQSQFQRHIRIHTGERPYKCTICPNSFHNTSALKSHIQSHTGEKPYKCPTCGKGYTRSRSMKLHYLSHPVVSTP